MDYKYLSFSPTVGYLHHLFFILLHEKLKIIPWKLMKLIFYIYVFDSRYARRDWGQEEKGTTEEKMAGRHHRLDEHEFEWAPGVGDGQGGLVCCDSWGCKESDTTERLNWTDSLKQSYTLEPFRSRHIRIHISDHRERYIPQARAQEHWTHD